VSFAAVTPCVASKRVFIFVLFIYRLRPETFGYTFVYELRRFGLTQDKLNFILRTWRFSLSPPPN